MSGRSKEEVLARIAMHKASLKQWADRFNEFGEQNALHQVEELRAKLGELSWVLEAFPQEESRTVYLLNGPYEGQKARVVVPEDPDRLAIRGVIYKLITDPDTGKSLGAYAWVEED